MKKTVRRTVAAAAVAASVAAGGLAGTVVGVPAVAGAASTAGGAVGWVDEALGGLVDRGTISQEQADAVETALDEARPERRPGHHRFLRHVAPSVVAEALGMTEDELRTALEGDTTIADVARDKGVDIATIVDALVAALKERLDERVAAGDLTRERADEVLAEARDRATAFLNGERPDRGEGAGRGFGGGPWGERPGAPDVDPSAPGES